MNEFTTSMPEDFDARPNNAHISSDAYAMSAPVCIWRMLGLVGSFAGVVTLAVIFGVLGFLCAIFIPVIALAGLGVILNLPSNFFIFTSHDAEFLPFIISVLIALSILRGCLRYLEQLCNHYIAFKLLAVLRDKVFGVMRTLAPAKLSSSQAGNLISLITSDIELLEVFYAHTISPVLIASITSIIMVICAGILHPWCAFVALVSYVIVGLVVPVWIYSYMGNIGLQVREKAGDLTNCVLENLRGLAVVLQFSAIEARLERMITQSKQLLEHQKVVSDKAGLSFAVAGVLIMLLSLVQLCVCAVLVQQGSMLPLDGVIASVLLFSSFGPVVALANLGTSLQGTLASGKRVLSLLAEKPALRDVEQGVKLRPTSASVQQVQFSYPNTNECVLRDVSLEIPAGKIVGIAGKSGSGKSSLCRLLMRFWDVSQGRILLSDVPIDTIETRSLRAGQALVEQDTYIFHMSIKDNVLIARENASREDVQEACKRASLHDFIMSLPQGYDTQVSELGASLSGGQRQRLGLARAFLHDSSFLLLDEPTSNLDSLNEAVILSSLRSLAGKRTVVLISHRASTMNSADVHYTLDCGRVS